MEWTFCAETFPQVWDHRVLGIKTQLRTWLWQDLKQLTVLHPAPESGETCKVELRSPHFPTKLDYWKEAVSFCICAVTKVSSNLTLLIPVTALSQNYRTEAEGDHLEHWDHLIQALSSDQDWLPRALNISKERDSTYDNHGTELFKQENGLKSFFINITSKSNSSTCKKDNT